MLPAGLVVWFGFVGVASITKKDKIDNRKGYNCEGKPDYSAVNKIVHVYHTYFFIICYNSGTMSNKDVLQKELDFYQKQKQEYIKLYKDQFVLIKEQKLIGTFTTDAE